jgi:hypothetical protein
MKMSANTDDLEKAAEMSSAAGENAASNDTEVIEVTMSNTSRASESHERNQEPYVDKDIVLESEKHRIIELYKNTNGKFPYVDKIISISTTDYKFSQPFPFHGEISNR